MNKSKLVKVLRLFSSQDLKKLLEFAEGSCFNKDKKVNTLLKFLKSKAPQYEFEKERVFHGGSKSEDFKTLRSARIFFEQGKYIQYLKQTQKISTKRSDIQSIIYGQKVALHMAFLKDRDALKTFLIEQGER